ncbi:DUF1269 domain-containing protein, partial [Streptomyces sp. SID10244]|nr:DUF1269 domain-containing protein [Streptomyces sp. SID10244]
MTEEAAHELGPIDYVVLEWPDKQPNGEAIPYLIDLVDRGVIRIIDLAFVMKDEDGSITQIELDQLGADFEVFDGVSTDLISTD